MLSYQSLMSAVAGTPRYENEAWSFEVFGCGWCHPAPLDSGLRRNDEAGAGGIQAYLRPRNTIFVPRAMCGLQIMGRPWVAKSASGGGRTASGQALIRSSGNFLECPVRLSSPDRELLVQSRR